MSNTNIQAYVLFNATTNTPYDKSPKLVSLNCTEFEASSPRKAWLKRKQANSVAGGSIMLYNLTFDENDKEIDSNTLSGVLVQQGASSLFIDAEDEAAVLDTCNACCDSGTDTVPRFYASGVPAYSGGTATLYTVQRVDDGTVTDIAKFSMDYSQQSIGNVVHTGYSDSPKGSTYKIYCIGAISLIGNDTAS